MKTVRLDENGWLECVDSPWNLSCPFSAQDVRCGRWCARFDTEERAEVKYAMCGDDRIGILQEGE